MIYKLFARGPPLWFRQITTDPHTLDHVNTVCVCVCVCVDEDRYTELKIKISELILDSYQYIPVAHVTVHCMI